MRPGPPPILYPLALVMLVGAAEPRRPDDFLTRIELLAVLETLNADLLSHPSATLTLERWCGAHHLAPEAKLTARLVRGADKALPAEDRHGLALSEGEPVRSGGTFADYAGILDGPTRPRCGRVPSIGRHVTLIPPLRWRAGRCAQDRHRFSTPSRS